MEVSLGTKRRLDQAGENKQGGLISFKTWDEVSQIVRAKGLYPHDGKMDRVNGEQLSSLMRMQNMQQMENRINSLVLDVQTVSDMQQQRMDQAIRIADTSTDSHELAYMAGMFIHHREVIRALAKNKNLDERTQQVLLNDPVLGQDREVQMNLAHNPALSLTAMKILAGRTQDPFVLQGVVSNAVRKSRQSLQTVNCPYAELCQNLAFHKDSTLSMTAIYGVKDANVLRKIAADSHMLTASDKLVAVVDNRHTPDDVLESLANKPLSILQPLFGVDVSGKARRVLSDRAHRNGLDAETPSV